MKKLIQVLGGLLMCVGVSSSAEASLIKIDKTVDLSSAYFYCNAIYPCGLDESYSLPAPVLISTGDTVDMTVRFAHRQALKMTNTGGRDFFSAWLMPDYKLSQPNTSIGYMSDINLTLFDAFGNAVLSLDDPFQYFGSANIGPQFVGAILPLHTNITFSSYRTTFNVASLQGGSQYYSGPNVEFFEINQGTVRLVGAEVPEPSTRILDLVGLMALAAICLATKPASQR